METWKLVRTKIDGEGGPDTATGPCAGCEAVVVIPVPGAAKGSTALKCPQCGVMNTIDVKG
jgi:hypothetical protein